MRRRLIPLAVAFASVTMSAAPRSSHGQTVHADAVRKIPTVPFGLRERATYKVSFGGLGVGKGTVEVAGIDTIRGIPAYHLVFKIKGGIPLAHVDDTQESWVDVSRLVSLRFHQNLKEVNYKRNLTVDMFPTEMIWNSVNHLASPDDREKTGQLASALPLDDVSFMYWARTIPLEVGKTYTYARYFKADGNPVIVKVLRIQKVKVPAGTFETIVVQPIIKTKGLFSEGGEAELYFTNDSRRMLVMLSTKLSIGSLKMHLESYQPGEPLTTAHL